MQRIKLATELPQRTRGTNVYILDEPITGPHFDDVARLPTMPQALVDLDKTVIFIELDRDVIKTVD